MTDFERELEEKRKAFDAAQAAAAKEAEEKRRTSETIAADGIRALKNHAIPTLLRAQAGLQKIEMDLLIEEEFDVANFSNPVPKISATCGSPARKSDGYRMQSRPLIIEVKNGVFVVGIGKEYNRRHIEEKITEVDPSRSEAVINEQLLKLTDEALAKLKDFHGPWN